MKFVNSVYFFAAAIFPFFFVGNANVRPTLKCNERYECFHLVCIHTHILQAMSNLSETRHEEHDGRNIAMLDRKDRYFSASTGLFMASKLDIKKDRYIFQYSFIVAE